MNKSSTSTQIISLPKGGGALHGLGEKFSPDLHTGTGNFTVPIALPPGRNGFQPQLNLVYSTGNGNGPFGLGWNLSVPGISRRTSKGVPKYDDEKDVFVLSGAEDLVPVPGAESGAQRYRPRTEGLFALIDHYHTSTQNYWLVRSKDGLKSFYGTADPSVDPAVIAKPDDRGRIFGWKLTGTEDPFGNKILYTYLRDMAVQESHHWDQLYLQQIRYVDYTDQTGKEQFLVSVTFEYDNRDAERPDPFSEYRAGFEIRTRWRCSRILIQTHPTDGILPVRAYELHYEQDPANGVSLLEQIQVVGFNDEGVEARELPPLQFGYTRFEPEKRDFFPVAGKDLPARSLANQDLELVDLFGNGLPDILEMNSTVRYWRNLGDGSFDLPRPMRDAPPVALAQQGVQLIDANGDGRTDLLVTLNGLSGYFPLCFGGLWDRKSFQKYERPPSFNLEDPEVRLVDLTGDGVTDVIRSGTRLECFFNDPHKGWLSDNTRWVERRGLEEFPNVNFSDPRVKWADMSGDGLQDIVLVHDGNVEYWPNLGYGNWGKRIHMNNSPRFRDSAYHLGYDPRRILIGDVDGDGLADIIYVDNRKVTLWINQSGNSWSDPVEIDGTPPVSDMDAVRLVDLLGTGISGVLWSSDFTALSRGHMFFLDLTGGVKPYLLNEMDNHMGAVTKVEYTPSTKFYLEDQNQPKTRWKTPLPFPVQTVSRVEVIDEISKGKLTTEYRYHHGYWDGAEREFRGFGMVEQFDTETFEDYNRPGLHGEARSFQKIEDWERFSAPTLTKTWFHQGPIGEEFGDWEESDYSAEYWDGDPKLLSHTDQVNAFLRNYNDRDGGAAASPGNRRIKRDALRTLRGSILRTELYALDGSERQDRPYTVAEHAYGLHEESRPAFSDRERQRIFFPHLLAKRTTQWERGDDPMTQFSFTGYSNSSVEFDPFGRALHQTAVAMPRRDAKRRPASGAVVGSIDPDQTSVLATHSLTTYATPSHNEVYIHDRVATTTVFELAAPTAGPDDSSDSARSALQKQWQLAQQVRDSFTTPRSGSRRLIGHTVNYYDGSAFIGVAAGALGNRGALVRTESLVFTDEILETAFGDRANERFPSFLDGNTPSPNQPDGFASRTGYHRVVANSGGVPPGWYASTMRRRYDFHSGSARPRGLVGESRDARNGTTSIGYDVYDLLPVQVTDANGLTTAARYNYRVMQPARMTDPNGSSTNIVYNPIGLPLAQFVRGLDAQGGETLGGTDKKPEITFRYDFLHFEREGKPLFVHTTRRIHHASDNISDETIETYEYSDGFGRLVQTRAQAEEFIFGATGDDVGLPTQAGTEPDPAVAQRAVDRVVVSGWQLYDNKGRVIEKYEPFFSQGFDFEPEADAKRGQHVTMFYDPRDNLIRTLNPDGSQQRVILGRPLDPQDLVLDPTHLESQDVPDSFEPTPWETYTYDANDLAPLCLAQDGASLASRAPHTHHFTPASGVIDALGRMLCQVQRNGGDPAKDWFITRTEYDLRGNTLKIVDALNRDAFKHVYDLLNRPLRVKSIDAGLRTSVLDASGNLIEYRDSKGSLVRRTYDALHRSKELWARDDSGGAFTLRERIHYGDEGDRDQAKRRHTLGRPVAHYDEAGSLETPSYDFQGNLLEKFRRVISDDALANGWTANWSVASAEDALVAVSYRTSSRYDALNRPTQLTYPEDVGGERKALTLHYNRAGALAAVSVAGHKFVEHIAYNAKGQRVLIAYRNNLMTRYAYDPLTFRLARLRTDRVSQPGLVRRFLGFFLGDSTDTISFESSGSAIQDYAYAYDLAGNITIIDERTPNCGVTDSAEGRDRLLREFNYDPIYHLTDATGRACKDIGMSRGLADDPRCGFYPGGTATATQDNAPDLTERYTERYSYDPVGNMLELNYQALSSNWKRVFGMDDLPSDRWMDAQNNRLTSLQNGATSNGYRFDDNGNLIQQNTERHHVWDHADRMIGYRVQPNSNSPASIEARYLYGGDGMRVKKWVRRNGNGGKDESIVYIDGFFEHQRWPENGAPKQNNHLHVMDNQNRIAIVRVGEKDPDDGGERMQYHLGDHLSSSHIVIGGDAFSDNAFLHREEYFPYGETSFGSFARKRYRYSGKERDEESRLYYYGARYLAPWMVRWVSCDPICIQIDRKQPERNRHIAKEKTCFRAFSSNPIGHTDRDGQATKPVVDARTQLKAAEEIQRTFDIATREFGLADVQDRRQLGTLADDVAVGLLEKNGIWIEGKNYKVVAHPVYKTNKLVTSLDLKVPDLQLAVELKLTPNAVRARQEAKHLFWAYTEKMAYARVYAQHAPDRAPIIFISKTSVQEIGRAAGWIKLAKFVSKYVAPPVMFLSVLRIADDYAKGRIDEDTAAAQLAELSLPGALVSATIEHGPDMVRESAPALAETFFEPTGIDVVDIMRDPRAGAR